jgi:nitrite reductase/ring-hydroxylating ferredoxin subunit
MDRHSQPFGGYHHTHEPEIEPELTLAGPGTPMGEYLRRFWQPVGLARDLGDLPRAIRVMNEDLVLFRDGLGRIGLLHRRCCHRRASLEYGWIRERGIQCSYHGWHFDIDGTILAMPAEPDDSPAKRAMPKKLCQGAYPTEEFKGLIFAYLGPPEEKPAFPRFDSFDIEGMTMTPYAMTWPCNWLQVLDAIVDPVHTSVLHSPPERPQFSDGLGEYGELNFFESDTGVYGANTRRVKSNIWVRINELILPNFTQAGAAFACDGTKPRYFGRSAFTRWVVPQDDTHAHIIAWANFGERADPPEFNTPEGIDKIEQGEVAERPYEARQRRPGDYEATTGMGLITRHRLEHLSAVDEGVVAMRRRLRMAVRALSNGEAPRQPGQGRDDASIPTWGGDTVLALPADGLNDDRALLQAVANAVIAIHREGDEVTPHDRFAFMDERLRALEAGGTQILQATKGAET